MLLNNLWRFLTEYILSISNAVSADKPVFNLYNQELPALDRPGAAQIRRNNLAAYLRSFPARPPALLIGEAPGWRGCRFSGVPFTSEAQVISGALPFHGAASSAAAAPYREASATIFWRVMRPLHPHFLVWNALPLHLHQPGDPLSNRTPTRQELAQGIPVLRQVIDLLSPRIIIAVGNSAAAALSLAGIDHVVVRHPSHGGAKDFQAGIASLQNHITIGE